MKIKTPTLCRKIGVRLVINWKNAVVGREGSRFRIRVTLLQEVIGNSRRIWQAHKPNTRTFSIKFGSDLIEGGPPCLTWIFTASGVQS